MEFINQLITGGHHPESPLRFYRYHQAYWVTDELWLVEDNLWVALPGLLETLLN